MSETSTDLVRLPDGQIVDPTDMASCAKAIEDLRDLISMAQEAKGAITDAVDKYIELRGDGKTMHLDGGVKVTLKNADDVVWDAQQLEADLRAAGMPEDRIREIIVEEVSYKVAAAEANKAARVNDQYKAAVEAARHVVERRPSVSISRS